MTRLRSRFLAGVVAALAALALGAAAWPANAAALTNETVKLAPAAEQTQSVTVAAEAAAPTAARDGYSVTVVSVVSWPSSDHTVTDQGDFGPRGCRGCSSFHEGDDFNPGGGAPISVVADGTVIDAHCEGGGLGCQVWVQHTINGEPTVTVYGHMQFGSLRVATGQEIDRGTVLGACGDTGASTGNHLHFEVHVGGVKVNPLPWLQAHVNDTAWAWMD